MDERIRASDADRDHITTRLREHFAAGRLTSDELDHGWCAGAARDCCP